MFLVEREDDIIGPNIEQINLDSIITHGKDCAIRGHFFMDGNNYEVVVFISFQNITKTSVIKEIFYFLSS